MFLLFDWLTNWLFSNKYLISLHVITEKYTFYLCFIFMEKKTSGSFVFYGLKSFNATRRRQGEV